MWTTFTDFQLAIRLIIGAVFLPWTLATWVWQGTWNTGLQVLTIGALVLATLVLMRPARTVE
jgi:hypothetical protein